MTGRACKEKGARWERAIVAYLKDNGFPFIERAYGAGRNDDVGDIDGIPGVVIEAKDQQRFDLAGWSDEAEVERVNARAIYGVVIAKRPRRPVGEAYVIMPLEQFAQLLRDDDIEVLRTAVNT